MKQLTEQSHEHKGEIDVPGAQQDSAYVMQRFQWFVDSSSLCGEVPIRFEVADTPAAHVSS